MINLYTVKDNKAHSFGQVMCFPTDVEASRMLSRAVHDPEVQISHFPEDYDLFRVGSFDQVSGFIVPEPQPRFICGAVSFVKVQKGAQNA